MNPFDLDATGLMVWGLVAHLVADWPLQNDWMARNKAWPWRWSLAGLAPAFTHALIHAVLLGLVFGYWPGMAIGLAHLIVDTRKPVAWWSRLIRQTQPEQPYVVADQAPAGQAGIASVDEYERTILKVVRPVVMDLGTTVRFWNDQVWHIACIAVAALVVAHA